MVGAMSDAALERANPAAYAKMQIARAKTTRVILILVVALVILFGVGVVIEKLRKPCACDATDATDAEQPKKTEKLSAGSFFDMGV